MTSFLADKPQSVGELFRWRVAKSSEQVAFKYPLPDDSWTTMTWREADRRVTVLAAALIACGLDKEERVSIACSTRLEWVLVDLAISCAAGATTTIYPNTQADDFDHIIEHSESKILVAENWEQVEKLHNNPQVASQVTKIIVIDDDTKTPANSASAAVSAEKIITWDDFEKLGQEYLAAHPTCVDDRIATTGRDTLATLIYTSGTTGRPKGVELTHKNWIYEGFAMDALNIVRPDMTHYLWLPLSHVFGKCLIAVALAVGFATAVDGRVDKILPGMAATNPSIMCGAPRIFEKVRAAVMTKNRGIKSRISRWAFAVGRESRPYRLAGKPLPKALAIKYQLADKLVFSQLKQAMGGKVEFFISGSAKLSPQVQAWFYSAGITIIEGYGSTETSAVAFVNSPAETRFGTVGRVSPGSEAKIADDGEILVRGDGIMRGYHKAPDMTAEVLEDGWFHTGDIGVIDDEGFLTITDRKKDLLKTSGGKYVAPQKVESVVAANIPYLSQVVAVGDGRKYISALVTLDRDALFKWAAKRGKSDMSYAELTQLSEIYASIERFMKRANSHLERWETVKRFAILDHEFTVEEGGVTANMKLRRAHITKQYADIVDSLYDQEDIEEP